MFSFALWSLVIYALLLIAGFFTGAHYGLPMVGIFPGLLGIVGVVAYMGSAQGATDEQAWRNAQARAAVRRYVRRHAYISARGHIRITR